MQHQYLPPFRRTSLEPTVITFRTEPKHFRSLIPKHPHSIVLIIHVLHQLTQVTKLDRAMLTLVRKVGHRSTTRTPSIRQERIVFPTSVSLHMLIDLPTSIVFPRTSSAVSTLDMLHGIRWRFESSITTHRTTDLTWTMDLHVHVQFILVVELAATLFAFVLWGVEDVITNTIGATRAAFAFAPLIVGVPPIMEIHIASSALPVSHGEYLRYLEYNCDGGF